MSEREFEKMTHTRTAYACIEVALLSLCQIKHMSTQKDKQRLGIVEKKLDEYKNTIKLSVFKRQGKDGLEGMVNEFDKATDFMNVVIAIASIIPNHPTLQQNILDRFQKVVESELLTLK